LEEAEAALPADVRDAADLSRLDIDLITALQERAFWKVELTCLR
jgi:hypothetical protein